MAEKAFKKAAKSRARLRLNLQGPAGAGKTYTALAIGVHLGKRVGVIDTERGSACLYADKFEFDHLELGSFEPEAYLKAIAAARTEGIDVLVIDSLSHAWEALKERVDLVARTKYKGNTWSAWSEITPIQNSLVQAVLQYPGHVICTLRTKTAWETEKDERTGKSKPVKVGLAPIQRDGLDYEFTIVLELSEGGLAKVGKTRWSDIADQVFNKPGAEFAQRLLGWLDAGAPASDAPPQSTPQRLPVACEIEQLLSQIKDKATAVTAREFAGHAVAAGDQAMIARVVSRLRQILVDQEASSKSKELGGPQDGGSGGNATPPIATPAVQPPPGSLSAAMGVQPGDPLGPSPEATTIIDTRTGEIVGYAESEDATRAVPAGNIPDQSPISPPTAPPAASLSHSVPDMDEIIFYLGEAQLAHAQAFQKVLSAPTDAPEPVSVAVGNLMQSRSGKAHVDSAWREAGGQWTNKRPKERVPLTGRQLVTFWHHVRLAPSTRRDDQGPAVASM